MRFSLQFFGKHAELLWNTKSSSKDVIKTITNVNLPIRYKGQRTLNKTLQSTLKKLAKHPWTFEARSEFDHLTQLSKTGRKSVDARATGDRMDVEFEFGNHASPYRDLTKFNLHYNKGIIDLGVMILPTLAMSRTMGESISSFERVTDELRIIFQSQPVGHCPIVVIGLLPADNEGNSLIDLASKEQLDALRRNRTQRPVPVTA